MKVIRKIIKALLPNDYHEIDIELRIKACVNIEDLFDLWREYKDNKDQYHLKEQNKIINLFALKMQTI